MQRSFLEKCRGAGKLIAPSNDWGDPSDDWRASENGRGRQNSRPLELLTSTVLQLFLRKKTKQRYYGT